MRSFPKESSPKHPFDDADMERFLKYPEAMDKFKSAQSELFKDFPDGVKYIIVSDKINLSYANKMAFDNLKKEGLQNPTWETLLKKTKTTHRAFLDAREKLYKQSAEKD